MEFPFDLSIIWLALLLSIHLLMAYMIRSRYLPNFRRQKRVGSVTTKLIKVTVGYNDVTERFSIVFRKIPTKEQGGTLIDEDHRFLRGN